MLHNIHTNIHKIRFFHLDLVVTVARLGTIRATARHFNLTQPAVTRALQELESQLGAPLFDRTRQGMTTNPYGDRFITQAQTMLNLMKTVQEDIDHMSSGTIGDVHLGLLPTANSNLIPILVGELEKQGYDLSIKVQEGPIDILLPMLMEGTIDILIGRLPTPSPGTTLHQTILFYDSFAIVSGPDNPLVNQSELKLKDLLDKRWIFPSPTTSLLMADVIETFNREKLPVPTPVLEINSLQTIRTLLRSTEMISIFSYQMALEESNHDLISILPVDFNSIVTPIGITTRLDDQTTPATHTIVNQLKKLSDQFVNNPKFDAPR